MIDNWHGKPIGDLTRGELIDALDWCVGELRKQNADYKHQTKLADECRECGGGPCRRRPRHGQGAC